MFNPCVDHCYLRHGKQYTKQCDDKCDYAKIAKESSIKDKIIEYLLDMLEEGHMGMMGVARDEVKNRFGINV